MALTWWVGEQLQPDGSALFAIMSDSKPNDHPIARKDQAIFGPYASQAAATQARDSGNYIHARSHYLGSDVRLVGGKLVAGSQNPPGTIPAIDLFHGLDLGSILLRIGEVLLGIVLIGVGLARVTGVENAVSSAVKNMKVIPI